jgi:hypothetical protein
MEHQTTSDQPTLEISDLKLAAEIIATCTQRGAFRANEMSTVGALYDRLTAFTNAATAANATEAPAAEVPTPKSTEELQEN